MTSKKQIEQLECEIKTRDELIYALVRNTHGYMHFMVDHSVGIEKLRKTFNVEELLKSRIARNRIKLLTDERLERREREMIRYCKCNMRQWEWPLPGRDDEVFCEVCGTAYDFDLLLEFYLSAHPTMNKICDNCRFWDRIEDEEVGEYERPRRPCLFMKWPQPVTKFDFYCIIWKEEEGRDK